MIRVLLVSDSHGITEKNLKTLIKQESPDLSFHLGDHLLNTQAMSSLFTQFVNGNCDIEHGRHSIFYTMVDQQNNRKYNVFLAHSDTLYCHTEQELLNKFVEIGKSKNLSMIFYGHTHVPLFKKVDNIFIVNPGSLRSNRSGEYKCSYCVLTINNDVINCEWKEYKNL